MAKIKEEESVFPSEEFTIRQYHHPPDTSVSFYNLRSLISHLYGKLLFNYLRFRCRYLLRDLNPLAQHLEGEIFPALQERKQKALVPKDITH